MKIFRRIIVSSVLLIQTSVCFAQSEKSINFTSAPYIAPKHVCEMFGIEVAITEKITLGVSPAVNCKNRASVTDRKVGLDFPSGVTNKFNRILIPWIYAPAGSFHTGYFVQILSGVERGEYKTAAGSSANVTFINTGFTGGYQWFWGNGFNISVNLGVAHLVRYKFDRNISPAETSNIIINYLDQQTSTNTHPAGGIQFGWAF